MTRRAAVALIAMLLAACGRGPNTTATSPSLAVVTTTTLHQVTAAEAAAFVIDLMGASNATDDAFLVAHLDPVVTGVYGEAACAAHIRALPHQSRVAVTATEGPANYAFPYDTLTITVPNVFTVRVDDTTTGKVVHGAVHVGTSGGVPRWFVDCGTPLPSDQRNLPAYETE